ncbi:MAG TPA: hypothetical protein VGD10_08270 [Allosphingosinicella sp.]|uniref:hypothetical protein n=1 Tax=Allosphingosinicella sp. TaxID=2823234 RepID=UPI002EDA7F93
MSDRSYLDEHRAYLGASGSGKSTTARHDVEQLLEDKRHVCITDHTGVWYGLRSDRAGTGPGFDIPIFGGRRGDVAIGAGDGDAIGRIVGEGVSAIVDLSALRSGPEQREFMRDFVAALRRKPAGHFQLVADEADEDVPEKARDQAGFELAEDMIWIAKRGRSDGFVLSLITQRPASIAKEALSQAQTIFAHQLTAPTDRDAFGRYVKAHGTKQEHDEIMARLPTLQVGERYMYRPRLHVLELGKTPRPITFDSSRTPGPGEAKREPKLLSQIDVSAIAAALKKPADSSAAEAATGIPERSLPLLAEKTREILELTDRAAAAEAELKEVRAELMVARHKVSRVAIVAASMADLAEELRSIVAGQAAAPIDASLQPAGRSEEVSLPPASSAAGGQEGEASPRPLSKAKASSSDTNAMRGRKALAALVERASGLTERQWAWISGFSIKGGTWGTYKSALRAAGHVEERGGKWYPTGAAYQFDLDGFGPFPQLGPELARAWGGRISGVRRMVDVLIDRWPDWTLRASLADRLNMAADGGTFGAYISRLKSAGMIEQDGKKLRLSAELMGEVL